jgi:hypothetical protein
MLMPCPATTATGGDASPGLEGRQLGDAWPLLAAASGAGVLLELLGAGSVVVE